MRPSTTPPSPAAALEIDVLKSMVAIAETGSIKLAAPRLGRTPAAVSMQITKLERTLGRTLFERVHSGMRLTASGERLLPHARLVIETERAILDEFRASALAGEVRVGVIDDFTGVRLAAVLADFARAHARLTVNVSVATSVELAGRLARGELDLAVLTPGGAVPWQEGDRVVHDSPLVWVGREGGRAWRHRPMPLALASHGCAWRRQALAALDAAGIDWRIAYLSEHYAAHKSAVAADLAVAPLPRGLLEPGLVRLGAADGLPDPGVARIALRFAPRSEMRKAAESLAQAIVRSFGAPAQP